MLGKREPEIYGRQTLADVEARCRVVGTEYGFAVDFRQSNSEATLIDWIQESRETAAGLIINPAGLTHTSVPLLDALAMCLCPVLEVHISNVHKREEFRHFSYVSRAATGVLTGLGTHGYELAIRHLAHLLEVAPKRK